MPNVKIFVDDTLYPGCQAALARALPALRQLLCREFSVDIPACQFAVMPVMAMPDLPRVNVEMLILPHPDRTRDHVLQVCQQTRALMQDTTGAHTAIRVSFLDPATYIALK